MHLPGRLGTPPHECRRCSSTPGVQVEAVAWAGDLEEEWSEQV